MKMIQFIEPKVKSVPMAGRWAVWRISPSSTVEEVMAECRCDSACALAAINDAIEDDERIRADERKRIAKYLKDHATAKILDPTSDGVDGYTGACILDLADSIGGEQ